jgi:uncharacterized protein
MELNVRPVPIPDPVTQFFWDSTKEGRLAFTILHQPFHPGFVDAVPMIIGLTELDDAPGVWILANIVEADPAELHCGLPMEVVFEQREEFALPQFRPRRGAAN